MTSVRIAFSFILLLPLTAVYSSDAVPVNSKPDVSLSQQKTAIVLASAPRTSKIAGAVNLSRMGITLPDSSGDAGSDARAVSVNGRWLVVGDRALNRAWLYDLNSEDIASSYTRLSGNSSTIYFGHAVFTDGNYVAVGDPYWSARGVVRLFSVNNEAPDKTPEHFTDLSASDAAAADMFGYDISMSSGYLVVGSPDTTQPGKVYLYQIDNKLLYLTGKSEVILGAHDGESGNMYGSVSTNGKYVVAGAMSQGAGGAVYLYRINKDQVNKTPLTEIKITSPMATDGDQFGADVAVSDDYLLVGQPFSDTQGMHASGTAWLYHIDDDDLSSTAKKYIQLKPTDLYPDMHFGMTVDMMGDYAIVGTLFDDNTAGAYLFNLKADDINASQVNLTAAEYNAVRTGPIGVSVATDGETSALRARFNGRFFLYLHKN